MEQIKQRRDWCFVVNNPKQNEKEFEDYLKTLTRVRYFVFVKEKGDGTKDNPNGTEHYQGYIEFDAPKKFTTMRMYLSEEKIGVNAHVAERKYTREACVLYVKKEGKFQDKKHTQIGEVHEWGHFSLGGERNDLTDMVDLRKNGSSEIEIFEQYPNSYARYESFVDHMALKYKGQSFKGERNVEVTYIYGPPQVGKSKYVYNLYGYDNVYCNQGYEVGKWFDGYMGQDVLLFDNYCADFKINLLLTYLSCQPVTIPCRFKNKMACYTKVYIVSTLSPYDQYDPLNSSDKDMVGAFIKRIDKVIRFLSNGEYQVEVDLRKDNTDPDEVF